MEVQTLKKTYFGAEAQKYDRKRAGQRIWPIEQSVTREMLASIAAKEDHLTLLDIPVGTGRFFEYYKELSCQVIGMDVSEDMLSEAKQKSEQLAYPVTLRLGDVFAISLPDNDVDVSLCMRLLNLFSFDDFSRALGELSRVSKQDIICGVTVKPSLGSLAVLPRLQACLRRFVTETIEFLKHGGNGFIRHDEGSVQSAFAQHNLTIVEQKRIDSGRGGYAYYIYHLRK